MKRVAGALALCWVVGACGWVQRVEAPRNPAEVLFDAGLEELAAGSPAAAFQTLRRDYPGGPWAARAGAVEALLEAGAAAAHHESLACAGRLARAEAEGRGLREQAETAAAQLRIEAAESVSERAALQAERERLLADGQACAARVEQLRAKNADLLKDLEQLKNLTIEMELRR